MLVPVILAIGINLSAQSREGTEIIIPGDVNRICYYTDFFYNFPARDFIYHLNDRLLFMEKPDGRIMGKGLRNKLLKINRWHKVIKRSLKRYVNRDNGLIALEVSDSGKFKKAFVILELLGLQLKVDEKNPKRRYQVARSAYSGVTDYFNFTLMRVETIQRQLNRSGRFYFNINESTVPIPWDLEFLGDITGLKLEPENVYETMLANERFSLLLAVLYRLSEREIRYIARMPGELRVGAWKAIYEDQQLLMGMFVLSHALRVDDRGRMLLPGGSDAAFFWQRLAGFDAPPEPLQFLRSLAVNDEGKLNYFFIFASFLSPEMQTFFFTGSNMPHTKKLYEAISLEEHERLNLKRFPRLNHINPFLTLYGLKLKDGRIHIPKGVKYWESMVNSVPFPGDDPGNPFPDEFKLLTALFTVSFNEKNVIPKLRQFLSIYTRYSDRPELSDPETLGLLNQNYINRNVMLDFIEKIPLKKPATVKNLNQWVASLEYGELSKKDRALFTALSQAYLELLGCAARYAPLKYDYDALVEELLRLPFEREAFYNRMFQLFESHLHLSPDGKSLIDFVLEGVGNRVVNLNQTDYRLVIKDVYKEDILEILKSQEVCRLSWLFQLNRLLSQLLENGSAPYSLTFSQQLMDLLNLLPYAEISSDAPREIRGRVMAYSWDTLARISRELKAGIEENASPNKIRRLVRQLREEVLVNHLKDHMVALVYAFNAGDPDLRIFLNPNLVRLHDFENRKDRTPWNYCGSPDVASHFSEYHFSGGLSRLNLALASKWQSHLFKRTYIYNPAYIQSVLINLLDFYPLPNVGPGLEYNALLVDFGLELLKESESNPLLRSQIIARIGTITSGFHYRRAIRYLDRKAGDHDLSFSHIKLLGEHFFKQKMYLQIFSRREQLEAFSRAPLIQVIARENSRFGGIYYRTFGSLKTQDLSLFPQELSILLAPGWLGGEMLDEFKIKLSWHLYHRQIPPVLLGDVLYVYFSKTAPRFLSQNHPNDYFTTHFIFDIFNNTHLSRIIQDLKKEGHLRLK